MFDFAWSEIALIGVVALVLIGPKDLPVAIKAVAGMVKKARRMAGEFQVHVDEMVREADLHEVRREFNDLRRMDIKGKILNAMDGDGSIRKTMADNPLHGATQFDTPVAAPVAPTTVGDASTGDLAGDPVPTSPAVERAIHLPDPDAAPAVLPGTSVPAAPASAAAPAMIPPADAKQPSHG